MMAWTDRHCRYLHRLFNPRAVLFTEMVTTGALLTGGRWEQLDFDAAEHPVVLQLGGNNPDDLAKCAARAAALGFDEINLNVGCPSDRVQRGTFGACLMLKPALVAECMAAMQAVSSVPVSVKCRLGVDEHDSDELLREFIDVVSTSGCTRFYIHARKAILGGLTPAQNRSIPPLQIERVQALKAAREDLQVIVNGGIDSVEQVAAHLSWADGVMLGRAAYHNPRLLTQIESELFGWHTGPSTIEILQRYRTYMATQLLQGVPLQAMTRHMLSTCNGLPGARRFRQILSDNKRLKANRLEILDEALAQVFGTAA